MTIIFLDIESTGVNVDTDRIIDIAMIKVTYVGQQPMSMEEKSLRVYPEMPIPEGASLIHGIYDKDVELCQPFRKYAKAIEAYLFGCDIAGFNSNRFDLPLLNNEFIRAGIDWDYSQHNLIDVGNIFMLLNPRTLTAAALKYLGEVDETQTHNALYDTKLTMQVFNKMLVTEELPKESSELALYSNYDRPILDLSGKFTHNAEGEIIFNFGKYRGEKAAEHLDFVEWMVRANFPIDTLNICYQLLQQT